MPETLAQAVVSSQARSLRLALVGSAISALGLLASLREVTLLSGFWMCALLACLAYGWLGQRRGGATAPVVAETPAVEANDAAVATPPESTRDAAAGSEEARFLASAGHDMRQPLQAISLFSATLAAHPLPAESAKLVAGIEQAAESLSELFEAVVALARLMAGRVQLLRQPVALGPLLKRCVAERMLVAQDKEIHLRHVPTRAQIEADEAQLARALDCLIAHAVATTAPEGGIVVGCRRDPAGLRIEVWDNGKPIPIEAMDEVFEPFACYGQAFADRGLGLVLAQRLMRAMGGDVTLGPARAGKRFVMRLPG